MRARGTGSVYQRPGHDARWHLKYYDARGKAHYESAMTRVDAERLLRRRFGEVAQGRRLVGRERERTTFDDLERLIVDDYRLRGRKSLDSVCQSFRALRRVFGGRRACDIGYEDLTRYAADRGAAPATARRELALLHRAFVLAHRAERVTEVPPFPTVAVNNARRGFFELETWQSVRCELAPHLQDVGDFAYLTGWRVMEMLRLLWADVDSARGSIVLASRDTKNGRARAFPFRDFPELADLLERRRAVTGEVQRARERIIPWVFHDAGEPLFGADGRPKRSFRRAWRRACAAAGQPGRILHDFRRTAVRNLERMGVPRAAAMALVGHKTESVYRRYDIVSERDLTDAVKCYAGRVRLPQRLPSAPKSADLLE
jgi:integrase